MAGGAGRGGGRRRRARAGGCRVWQGWLVVLGLDGVGLWGVCEMLGQLGWEG